MAFVLRLGVTFSPTPDYRRCRYPTPRASEPVPHLDPVAPVLDSLACHLVTVHHLQLGRRNRQSPIMFPGRLLSHCTGGEITPIGKSLHGTVGSWPRLTGKRGRTVSRPSS